MQEFPDVVTHNFDPERGPFRNICRLSEATAEQILDDIRASGRRTIKPGYLSRRLDRPIYLFLGNFADAPIERFLSEADRQGQ